MLFDAHTHLADERARPYYRLPVATTPAECKLLLQVSQDDPFCFFACGVHPWRSDSVSKESLTPWFSQCHAVGEIGMDRTWCSIDLALQQTVFRTQLQLAQELELPIILHTKGCEAEILDEIHQFPHPILVHWYSSPQHISAYMDLGCYFSIGPDLHTNPVVQSLARLVPFNRLCVETDGAEGAAWALGTSPSSVHLSAVLQSSIEEIARIRGISSSVLEQLCTENMLRFLGQ